MACLDATNPGSRDVLEIRELLVQLYCTYQRGPPPHCRGPSRFREHVAPKSGSHYLLFLEEECEDVSAPLQPHGMAMISQDIVDSVNRVVKLGYNDHSDRRGGCVEHPTLCKARVVAQVWEWWFMQFDLPLHTRAVPRGMLQATAMQEVLPVVVCIALQAAVLLAALPPLGGGIPYCLVVDGPHLGGNRDTHPPVDPGSIAGAGNGGNTFHASPGKAAAVVDVLQNVKTSKNLKCSKKFMKLKKKNLGNFAGILSFFDL